MDICYTEFVNTITQRPQTDQVPADRAARRKRRQTWGWRLEPTGKKAAAKREFIFEPDAPELLGGLLPRFVETRVYQILLEAIASEFGARMTAMTNATKNANDRSRA